MFTGLVQGVGLVIECTPQKLLIHDPEAWGSDPWSLGESVAINGCCLTLVSYTEPGLTFDLSPETWSRTSFQSLKPGVPVNMERAMRIEDRFGGHVVQGHVDGVGEFICSRQEAGSWEFIFRAPEDRYLIDKGSIAIEGISLTVVEPQNGKFSVWVIPHTYENTSLSGLEPGAPVNIEYDILARYLEKLVSRQ